MDINDCISCPYVTNKGNCDLHLCSPIDVTQCEYWANLLALHALSNHRQRVRDRANTSLPRKMDS